MYEIFTYVQDQLVLMSELLGYSYKTTNIIIYFFLAPLLFWWPIDKLTNKYHVVKLTHLLIVLSIIFFTNDFETFGQNSFSFWEQFLNSFTIFGLNYITSSVLFCVLIPTAIWVTLIWNAYKAQLKNLFKIWFESK